MSDLPHTFVHDHAEMARDLLDIQCAIIDAGTNLTAAMDKLAQGALRVFPHANGAMVKLREGGVLVTEAASGTSSVCRHVRNAVRGSLADRAILTRRPYLSRDSGRETGTDRQAWLRPDIRSFVSIPLMQAGEAAGVLIVHSEIADAFGADDVRTASLLAGSLGIALGQARASDVRPGRSVSDQRFEATFAHAPVGMAHVAPDGRFLLVNDQFCAIAGHSRAALLEHGFQKITHPDDLTSDLVHVRQLLEGKADRYSMEKRYIRSDTVVVWINLTVSLIRDAAGAPEFFVSVIEDVSDIKRAQADALLDPLTGLLNRRGLIERMTHEIARAAAMQAPLGLIYLDLDDFKSVNDRHGHAAGDACLLEVAEALGEGARLESAAARIGGDEFILLLPRTDAAQLTHAMDRLQAAIALVGQGRPWTVGASLGGFSLTPDAAVSPAALIERADMAMFEAKRAGRGRNHLAAASQSTTRPGAAPPQAAVQR